MHFIRSFGAALVAALSLSTVASAQMATPVPDFGGNFASMKFQLGTWVCKTTKNTAGRGAGRTETDTTTMTLDGHYQLTTGVSKPFDKARTRTINSTSYLGWDPATKVWVSWSADNFGNFGYQISPGWVGSKITFTDKWSSGGAPLGVAIITKVSETKTTSTYSVKTPKGIQTSENECTKA